MEQQRPEDPSELPAALLEFPSFLIFQVLRAARQLGTNPQDEGLRLPHVMVLAALAEFGAASQKEISDRLRIDASDLVAVLDDLERRGLANRARDERDRRRYSVTLTEHGRQILTRRLAMAGRMNDALLAPLSPTERTELHALLLRVHTHHQQRPGS